MFILKFTMLSFLSLPLKQIPDFAAIVLPNYVLVDERKGQGFFIFIFFFGKLLSVKLERKNVNVPPVH